MASGYDFMKSAQEKEMSDEEYKPLREEYDKKAAEMSGRIKKLIYAFLGVYAASLVIIFLFSTFKADSDLTGTYIWLAVEFLLAVFLYDPGAEAGKKHIYETNRRILLNSLKSKIKSYKIKLGLVIGLGLFFLFLNVMWWVIFGSAQSGETVELLRAI